MLGLAYGRAGRYDESIEALQKAVSITGAAPHIKAELARVLASSGRRDEAHKLLTELIEQAKVEYVSPVNLAKVYVGLNEVERVYEQFEKAVADHSVRLPWFMIDPCLDHLSSQSHFQDLLNRIGVTRRM